MRRLRFPMFPLSIVVLSCAAAPPVDAEARAVAYLVREVPRWKLDHKCYSCHHNGDAARALYAALRFGVAVPSSALTDTTRWLERPAGWDKNGGEGPFSDKKLARLQFAATLADALAAGQSKDRDALGRAARLVADLQDRDGSWQVVPEGTIGASITHGNALATYLARGTLQRANTDRYKEAVTKADQWVRQTPVETVLDAGALLLALDQARDLQATGQRRRAMDRIRKGEARAGGWGPYVTSPPEVFDTAVVLLALAGQEQTTEVKRWLARGRAFLHATQESDGSWAETTRPSGGDSYSQRLSTSGWATLALLVTRRIPANPRGK